MKNNNDNRNLSTIYENILENLDAGTVFGNSSQAQTLDNQDSYAKGDSRLPKVLGVQTRNGKLKKKKKKISLEIVPKI